MILWRMWALLLAVLAIGIYVAVISPARSHGTLSWAAEYRSASNVPCCTGPSERGEGDCAEIPEAIAMSAVLGSIIPVQFQSGERLIRVTAFFTSPDPHAPAVACVPGCLFRGAGV